MSKGYQGQSCSDTIRQCFAHGNQPLSYSLIVPLVRTQGAWTETTIWRHLMSTVVNLIPARYEWSTNEKFLFLRPDGRYEIYDKAVHPIPIE